MRYLGSKTRLAKWIASYLLKYKKTHTIYLEPFLGGGSIFEIVAPKFPLALGSDLSPDLMLLWQSLQDGWIPPDQISESIFWELKEQKSSPLKSFAGFCAAFNGAWFSGYAKNTRGDDYVGQSKRSCLRKISNFKQAVLACCSYDVYEPDSQYLVYCDPPYKNTASYKAVTVFDSDSYWKKITEWSLNGATVISSEYEAPPNWIEIASQIRSVKGGGSNSSGAHKNRENPAVEKLFIHESKL